MAARLLRSAEDEERGLSGWLNHRFDRLQAVYGRDPFRVHCLGTDFEICPRGDGVVCLGTELNSVPGW